MSSARAALEGSRTAVSSAVVYKHSTRWLTLSGATEKLLRPTHGFARPLKAPRRPLAAEASSSAFNETAALADGVQRLDGGLGKLATASVQQAEYVYVNSGSADFPHSVLILVSGPSSPQSRAVEREVRAHRHDAMQRHAAFSLLLFLAVLCCTLLHFMHRAIIIQNRYQVHNVHW